MLRYITHVGAILPVTGNKTIIGSKESFKKVGLYHITCDMYYSIDLQKQYTDQISPNQYYFAKQTDPVDFRTILVLYCGFYFTY